MQTANNARERKTRTEQMCTRVLGFYLLCRSSKCKQVRVNAWQAPLHAACIRSPWEPGSWIKQPEFASHQYSIVRHFVGHRIQLIWRYSASLGSMFTCAPRRSTITGTVLPTISSQPWPNTYCNNDGTGVSSALPPGAASWRSLVLKAIQQVVGGAHEGSIRCSGQ